jgi:hypothetical protein
MNFGLAFATEKIPGVKINLSALNNNHEPESAQTALEVYSKIFLPERNDEENIKRLTVLIHDASLGQKIDNAAQNHPVAQAPPEINEDEMMSDNHNKAYQHAALNKKNNTPAGTLYLTGNTNTVSQVAGIILGSPEFQRK